MAGQTSATRGGGHGFCGYSTLLALGLFTWVMLWISCVASDLGFGAALSFFGSALDAQHRFWALPWLCFVVCWPLALWTFSLSFTRFSSVCRRFSVFRLWLFAALLCRVGEASVPGPPVPGHLPGSEICSSDSSWQLAVCNPSGLGGKTFAFLDSPHDVMLLSETHLTAHGKRAFLGSLRSSGSALRNMITGHPVPPRHSASQVGQWSGTAILSSCPLRALPHGFDSLSYESGRLCLGSFCIRGLWVHGCVVYGPPTGPISTCRCPSRFEVRRWGLES